MKHLTITVLSLFFIFSSCGCRQGDDVVNALLASHDDKPPVLRSWEMVTQTSARLSFNEPVVIKPTDFTIDGKAVSDGTVSNGTVTLTLTDAIPLGQSARLEGRVEDLARNSVHFSIILWAKNPNPATVLINEFTTKGTEANPDRVELVVTGRGNLAGLTLYAGTPSLYSDRFIFADRWVERGTYLVVRFQEGTDGGEHTSEKLSGLSSNNGSLSVAVSPEWESAIIDAVVWGNVVTTTYEGFGSQALLTQVSQLYDGEQWNSQKSKDSVDSTDSTATRSFCRDRLSDTNSSADWYICDTRQASFGSLNSEKRYVP
ncbi:MAG: hypothetical protein GXY63_08315 [Spirochaetales bacterium]|nr:hypothetical protein [Spirochaetales bacterium]